MTAFRARHNLLITLALCACAWLAFDAQTAAPIDLNVRTQSGLVAGTAADGVAAYKGIPYAAPPVGPLRWAPPQPPHAWTGTRPASDFGASCMQASNITGVPPGSRALTQSEDCLFLNVWTPAVRTHPLPVMVFVHGGGNDYGSGSDRFSDGTAFAHDGVVLVTINYRLGVLGWFAPDPGGRDVNFGNLDQIAALRWVQNNIAAFGGDPKNVTLFGESAGGNDVMILAGAPPARGLFARVIAESEGLTFDPFPSFDEARVQTRSILLKLGLADDASVGSLRDLPADRFVIAGLDDPGPAVDGSLITSQNETQLVRSIRTPLMIGYNDGEWSLFGAGRARPRSLVSKLSSTEYDNLVALYRAKGDNDDGALSRALSRDVYFGAPSRWVAAVMHENGVPSYLYRFDYVLSLLAPNRAAAFHGSEIPYVFVSFPDLDPLSATDRTLISALHGCWIAFATTGTPSCPQAQGWQPYDPATDEAMIFDSSPAQRPLHDPALDLLARDLAPKP